MEFDAYKKIEMIICNYNPRGEEDYKGKINIENAINVINNGKETSQEEKDYLIGCLKRFDEILKRDGVKNLSGKTIYELYFSEILGLPNRKYDQSKLINRQCLKKDDKGHVGAYSDATSNEITLKNSEGKEVSIQQIGKITYIDRQIPNRDGSTNVLTTKNVYKYKVKIVNLKGKIEEHEIYTNFDYQLIDIESSNKQKYIDTIINVLLSEENIKLSKTNGYVGKIVPKDKKHDIEMGFERTDGKRYLYGANSSFCLEYTSEEASIVDAVESFRKKLKEKEKSQLLRRDDGGKNSFKKDEQKPQNNGKSDVVAILTFSKNGGKIERGSGYQGHTVSEDDEER